MRYSSEEDVRLLRSAGVGRSIVRALVMAVCFGAIVCVMGLSGLGGEARGGAAVLATALAWLLTVLGLLLAVVALLLLALSRRQGRPSLLTPGGIVLPGKRLVPWHEIDRCRVRRSEGAPLLAAWPRHDGSHEAVPLWLGVIPPGEEVEREVLQKIDRWIRRQGT